jgi:hypothetical protein
MSNRSSSELIEDCRAAARQPVLERLRWFEALQPLDVGKIDELIGATDWEQDRAWMPAALAQLVPPIYWLTRKRSDDADDDEQQLQLEGDVTSRLGERWIRILLGALSTGLPPAPILSRLHASVVDDDRWFALFDPVWTQITQLAHHDNRFVRYAAARLALRGKRITPAVTAALGELIAATTADTGDEVYGQQVFVDSLLIEIGKAGPLLSALAPRLEPLLAAKSGTFREAAAQAAGAIGERRLVPVLESLERSEQAHDDARIAAGRTSGDSPQDERRIHGAGAMRRFALWQLTGDLAWLGRALDDAEGRLLFAVRIYSALDKAPVDDRLLAGLAYAAQRPAWYGYACNVLAKIGVPAAATIAQLPPPPDDGGDTRFSFHHARWRGGLIDNAQLAGELEPLLAITSRAWVPYIATGLGTPGWTATIRAALGEDDQHGVFEALLAAPAIAAPFIPDLVAAGREDTVDALYCALPRETFWAHATA